MTTLPPRPFNTNLLFSILSLNHKTNTMTNESSKIASIELYNNTKHPDHYELTAYLLRLDTNVVRVDIYPKIGNKLNTTYESYIEGQKCELLPNEWDAIVVETMNRLSVNL